MIQILPAESSPVVAALIALGMVAAVLLWVRGMRWLSAKMAGWENLAQTFPAPEMERPGAHYENMSGWIGNAEFERGFALQLVQEGLLIRPGFAARRPVLIPWANVKEVAVSDVRLFGRQQHLLLTLDWEKRLKFSLPAIALPVIEKHVPPKRLHNVGSLWEQLKKRGGVDK